MGNNGEVRGNRVPLRAVVCSCVTQYAHMPAHVESCFQRSSTFCVPPISERNLLPHRVRAHCANCEGCACSRGLLYTLKYVGVCWHRTSPPVASCILYRASGASAHATSCFLLLACSFSLARSLSFSLACSLSRARALSLSLSLPPSSADTCVCVFARALSLSPSFSCVPWWAPPPPTSFSLFLSHVPVVDLGNQYTCV